MYLFILNILNNMNTYIKLNSIDMYTAILNKYTIS